MANTVDSTTPEALLRSIIDGSLTEFEDDQIVSIGQNRLSNFPDLEKIYLRSFLEFQSGVQDAFSQNPKLKTLILEAYPGKTSESGVNGTATFRNSGDGTTVAVFPGILSDRTLPAQFMGGIKFDTVDFGTGVNKLSSNCFLSPAGTTTSVSKIILRCPTIVTWTNSNAMGTLTGVTIYIPKLLYDHLGDGTANDYRAATNWSSAITSKSYTFAQIEGSVYENYYADGTPVSAL